MLGKTVNISLDETKGIFYILPQENVSEWTHFWCQYMYLCILYYFRYIGYVSNIVCFFDGLFVCVFVSKIIQKLKDWFPNLVEGSRMSRERTHSVWCRSGSEVREYFMNLVDKN